MATKKASPAQLAARKLFAERARAGTLGKKRKTAARKNPAKSLKLEPPLKRRGTKKTVRKNPHGPHTRVSAPAKFVIYRADPDGRPEGAALCHVPSKTDAVAIARMMTDKARRAHVIVGKGL